MTPSASSTDFTLTARERLLGSAYELFSQRGVRTVGIDDIVAHAGVARATLYRHFKSKDDLVLAFLDQREKLWTFGAVGAEARRRGVSAEEHLLAIFDVFDEWFQRADFEACAFINVLVEMGPVHPLGQASIAHLRNIRTMVQELATEAGIEDAEAFAASWHILMKGSIVSATEGDRSAARRAQTMARSLIASHQEH